MDIFLRKETYPQEKVPLWSITDDEVCACIQNGMIPKILLPDFDYRAGKPLIAVILAQDEHPDREKKDYTVYPDYVDAVVQAGGAPVFVVYDYVWEQLRLSRPQGILLIGGNFRLVKNHAYDSYERRPQTYVSMIHYAMHNNLPTFSICGGMQMLAVYKGAKVKTKINEGVAEQQSHKQKPEQLFHQVNLRPDSLISRIVQSSTIMTNSCHSSAIINQNLGDCLVTGWTDDNTVEVIEMAHPWSDFVLAVQWHPERLAVRGDEVSKMLFSSFVKACN